MENEELRMKNGELRMENEEGRMENKIAIQVHDPNGNSSLFILHSSLERAPH